MAKRVPATLRGSSDARGVRDVAGSAGEADDRGLDRARVLDGRDQHGAVALLHTRVVGEDLPHREARATATAACGARRDRVAAAAATAAEVATTATTAADALTALGRVAVGATGAAGARAAGLAVVAEREADAATGAAGTTRGVGPTEPAFGRELEREAVLAVTTAAGAAAAVVAARVERAAAAAATGDDDAISRGARDARRATTAAATLEAGHGLEAVGRATVGAAVRTTRTRGLAVGVTTRTADDHREHLARLHGHARGDLAAETSRRPLGVAAALRADRGDLERAHARRHRVGLGLAAVELER